MGRILVLGRVELMLIIVHLTHGRVELMRTNFDLLLLDLRRVGDGQDPDPAHTGNGEGREAR